MPILNPGLTVFNNGEVTPYLYSRSDFKKYLSSAQFLENIIPLIYGPMIKRSGTRYVVPAKYSNKDARLEPFVFSEDQAYILEFGDYYARFYTDAGIVVKTFEDTAEWVTSKAYIRGYDYIQASGPKYILDQVANAAAAYSPIQLKAANVKCIQVQRADDNALLDIGFLNKKINLASLISFAGGGDVYLTKWYDQSNNSHDILFAARADQTKIVTAGVLSNISEAGITFASSKTFSIPDSATLSFGTGTAETSGFSLAAAIQPLSTNPNYFISKESRATGAEQREYNFTFYSNSLYFTRWDNSLLSRRGVYCATNYSTDINAAHTYIATSAAGSTTEAGMAIYRDGTALALTADNLGATYVAMEDKTCPVGNYRIAASGTKELIGTSVYNFIGLFSRVLTQGEVTYINQVFSGTEVSTAGLIYRCLEDHTSGSLTTDIAAGKWVAQAIYEIPTPYSIDDIFDIDFEQNNDIVFMTLGTQQPYQLSRYGNTQWAIEATVFNDGPYQVENLITTKTLAPSAKTGSVTLTAVGHTPFSTDSIGQHVQIKHAGTPAIIGWGRITAVTSSTVATLLVVKDFGAITATSTWRLGHWTAARGYPRVNTFHSGRHYFAGSVTSPSRVDGSTPDEYNTFSPVDLTSGLVTDACAIFTSIAAGKSNIIQWLLSGDTLFAGTSGSEHAFVAEGGDTALTPTNYVVKGISQHGSVNIKPIKIDNNGLFVQRSGRKLRELTYDSLNAQYNLPNITTFAEHLTYSGIKQIVYQEEPFSTFWVVLHNGNLLSITYDKKQDVIAGGRQNLGGDYVRVISAAVIPFAQENRDQVWLLVERYINGQIVKYIEYIEKEFNDEVSIEQGFFVDCGSTYDRPLNIEYMVWDAGNQVTTIRVVGHGLTTNNVVVFRNILDFTSSADYSALNNRAFTITVVEPDYITINLDTSTYLPYSSFQGGTIRKKISALTSGLSHLEGETVDIVVDGVVQPQQVVTGGTITLVTPGATIHIGLNYRAYYKSLGLALVIKEGNPLAKKQKIHSLDIETYRTNYLKAGATINGSDVFDLVPFVPTDLTEQDSKKSKFAFPSAWDNKPQIILMSDKPAPMTVLSITPTTTVN